MCFCVLLCECCVVSPASCPPLPPPPGWQLRANNRLCLLNEFIQSFTLMPFLTVFCIIFSINIMWELYYPCLNACLKGITFFSDVKIILIPYCIIIPALQSYCEVGWGTKWTNTILFFILSKDPKGKQILLFNTTCSSVELLQVKKRETDFAVQHHLQYINTLVLVDVHLWGATPT